MSPTLDQLVPDPWRPLWCSFLRSMRAEARSPATMENYGYALAIFHRFLAAGGAVPALAEVKREHVQEFITHLHQTRTSGTAYNRFRALHRWFAWLVEEDELDASPMERMKAPRVRVQAPEILDEDALRKLLAACAGRDFQSRRDGALVRFLIDTGARRAELARMRLEDVDLDQLAVRLTGKGNRERVVAFGAKVARDLDRYLRARAAHRHAGSPAFWLGQHGPMAPTGIYQMLRSRARQAGIEQRVFTHLFRHIFADSWLAADGQETDLMTLAGWESLTMLRRYTKRRAAERARAAHRRLSPGDRI